MINDFYALLDSIASSSVYYGFLPSNKPVSGVVFIEGDAQRSLTSSGAPTFIMTDISIDVWGKTPTAVNAESQTIIDGLEGQNITQGDTRFCNFIVSSTSSSFEPENDLFQKTINLIAHHN